MGVPIRLVIDNQPVFICCDGCKKAAQDNPQETLAKVKKLKETQPRSPGEYSPSAPAAQQTGPSQQSSRDAKIQAALAKLPEADQALATQQKFCVVLAKSRLGSMGTPVKVMVGGQPVFLCCEACRDEALADPDATLKQAATLRAAKTDKK
jgi:hypothetical protein